MSKSPSSILQGTLDLMVLETLEQLGPRHGYGSARRIEPIGREQLIVNPGTVDLCLTRRVQMGWIATDWGRSENRRRATDSSLTDSGREQLRAETENRERISGLMDRVLQPVEG